MAFSDITETDKINFRSRLINALGEGYEVEMDKEVSSLMGAVKETFDYVIFHNGDAIAAVEYRFNVAVHMLVLNYQDVYINRYRKVGLKYGLVYFGERHGFLLWNKDGLKFEIFSFNDAIIAIKGEQKCGERISTESLRSAITELADENITDITTDQLHRNCSVKPVIAI